MKQAIWYLLGTIRFVLVTLLCAMAETLVTDGDKVKIGMIWCAGLIFVLGELRAEARP
mgnify:CR=1 FL=1